MPSVHFDITADDSKLQAGLKSANQSVKNFSQNVQKETTGIDSAMKTVGVAIGTYFSAQALAGFVKSVVQVRGEFQQLGIAFETMLGSKEKADKLMATAVQFAAKTPFTLTDVATNIKQLMAMGIGVDKVMGTVKALGDVASGVSVDMGRVALNYGQVATQGKLMGREMRDFMVMGIPLADELAKNLGKTKQEIADMVTAGKIGFPDVEKAFITMSSAGGKFFNLMEKQSMSVTGQLSNLTDKWDMMLNEIGSSNEGLIYSAIAGVSDLIKNYKTVAEVLGVLIGLFGVYKVAVMVVAYETKMMAVANELVVASNGVMALSDARVWAGKMALKDAQVALNKSMLANPYVLGAMAVAALGYAIYKLVTYETELEKTVKSVNSAIEKETDKTNELFGIIKVAATNTDEYKTAKQAILSQYGKYLPALASEKEGLEFIAIAQEEVNKRIKDNIILKSRGEAEAKISEESGAKKSAAKAGILSGLSGDSKGMASAYIDQYIKGGSTGIKETTELVHALESLGVSGGKAWREVSKLQGALIGEKEAVDGLNEALPILEVNQATKITKPAKAAAVEYKSLEDRIKEVEEAMDMAHGKELKRLAEKYVKLTEELKIREDIKNMAIMLAMDPSLAGKEGKLNLMTGAKGASNSQLIPTVTSGMTGSVTAQQAADAAHFKQVQGVVDSTGKQIKANVKDADELVKLSEDEKKKKVEMLNAMMDITYEMGKQLGLGEDTMKIMDETFSAVSKAASGDYIGAAFSAMMAVTDGLVALAGDFGAGERAAGIQKINDLLTEQNKIIQESSRKGDEEKKRTEELRLLKEKQLQLTKNEQDIDDKLSKKLGVGTIALMATGIGALGLLARAKQRKKLAEELASTQEELTAIDEQIKQAEQALKDMQVGGITENTLTSAIAKGFSEGKTSVDDFANYMNTVLLDAVTKIFSDEILADMQPLMDKVRASLSDKKLTKEEKDAITTEAKRVADENQGLWKDLTSSLDLGNTDKQAAGLGGQVQRAITEATGSELAGLFRRAADDGRLTRDYSKAAVTNLIAIEKNTMDTVIQLQLAVVELVAINGNTKAQYTGKI